MPNLTIEQKQYLINLVASRLGQMHAYGDQTRIEQLTALLHCLQEVTIERLPRDK